MRPVFADLVQELQRSIGFYSTTHRDTKVEKVVGVGNAFLLPGPQKYLQQNLGMTVDRPEAFKNVVPSPIADQPAFREQLLSFAVAYGLALQGLELTKVTSNLLPTEIAKSNDPGPQEKAKRREPKPRNSLNYNTTKRRS